MRSWDLKFGMVVAVGKLMDHNSQPSKMVAMETKNLNKFKLMLISFLDEPPTYRKFSIKGGGEALGGALIRERAFPPSSGFLQNENRTIFG